MDSSAIHDTFRHGFDSVCHKISPNHILEDIKPVKRPEMILTKKLELDILRSVQRIPSMPCSNLALDIINGDDECLSVDDLYLRQEESFDLHSTMEAKLGM